MYRILINFRMARAEEIIDSLLQIADDIEIGFDSGTTPIGEWAIEEQPYVED